MSTVWRGWWGQALDFRDKFSYFENILLIRRLEELSSTETKYAPGPNL